MPLGGEGARLGEGFQQPTDIQSCVARKSAGARWMRLIPQVPVRSVDDLRRRAMAAFEGG